MKQPRFFTIVVAIVIGLALVWQAPASAGKWSGSTPDNGMGQSVSGEGESTEAPDPADPTGCTIIYTSKTTITVTDNATGKVVSKKTITRMRKYKKKNCPPATPFVLKESRTTTVIVNNNADGTSTVNKDDQQTNPGGAPGYKRTESTEKHDKPDGKGNVTGGSSKTTERTTTGGKTERKVTGQNWDPAKGVWIDIPIELVQLSLLSLAPIMPDSASRGGYAQGVLVVNYTEPSGTSGQIVASGNVVITEPNGKHFRMQRVGEILLTGADLMRGRLQIVSDPLPGHATVQIVDRPPGTRPVVTQPAAPPVVTEGTSLTVSGSGLATGDGPSVLLCTKNACADGRLTTASDTQLRVETPKLPPGPCSLVVENGNGKFSKPEMINPVDVQLILPKSGTVGQTLDATVQLIGLMAENRNRTMQGTVNLLGPGTFESGGTSQTVTIVNGSAHFKMKAHGAGVISVNVRGVH